MHISIEERLNDRINELEKELSSHKEEMDRRNYQDSWNWRHLRNISKEENGNLPVPRLEICTTTSNFESICDFCLVYAFYDEIIVVPISSTRISGTRKSEGLQIPGRDGVNIWSLMQQLNLPGFLTDRKTHEKFIGPCETEPYDNN